MAAYVRTRPPSARPIGWAIALALLIAAPGCSFKYWRAPVDNDRLQLDFAGGGYKLPPAPVIVFYVDGLNKDALTTMAEAGELPRLKRLLLDRSAEVKYAVTGIPSVTFANATSMITGTFPGRHSVLGNKWFDRNTLICCDHLTIRCMGRANDEIPRPTIYEMLDDRPTAVALMQINRGVKVPVDVWPVQGGGDVALAWGLGHKMAGDRLVAQHLSRVGAAAREIGRWPDFLLVWMPAVDQAGHDSGVNSDDYRAAIRNLDESIGGVLEVLDEQGVLDKFTIVLTSDHGMMEAPRENYLRLEGWFPEELGIPVEYAEIDRDLPYAQRLARMRDKRAVLIRQGSRVAHLHLRTGEDWAQRPSAEEILSFADRFAARDEPDSGAPDTGGAGGATLPDLLLAEPAIDIVAVRDGENAVRLYGKDGAAVVQRTGPDGARRYSYRTTAGRDPLGYSADPRARSLCDGAPHGGREWLEATAEAQRPDVVPQIIEMFNHHRAGDLVMFAAEGWDFSRSELGGHGGIERGEMLIPLYFAGPGIEPGRVVHSGRLVDLVPTLIDLMGLSRRLQGVPLDGISLANQLRPAHVAVGHQSGRAKTDRHAAAVR